jgi:hypothetical protein
LPHFKIDGSPSAGYAPKPGKRRTTAVRVSAAGLFALAYIVAGCSSANYSMTRCPAAPVVGKAAKANGVKLLPGSAPNRQGSTSSTVWTCTYVPADQYESYLHGSHHAMTVEIYVFPKKLVSKRLLGSVDGHAALQSGKAIVSGSIMLAGQQAPVTLFRSGYGAWTGQRLPDGSYSALAIYLSSRQAPRPAGEFRDELQAMAQVSGLQ